MLDLGLVGIGDIKRTEFRDERQHHCGTDVSTPHHIAW